jgi:peptidoglycan/xylan/chitin deacetylase (PgdA/CDA1 family)
VAIRHDFLISLGSRTAAGVGCRACEVDLWTPKVLDLLRREHIKATFFVVGTQVAEHPELARRIAAEGHQLGVHTFTHANLSTAAGWRRSLELRQSELILAGAAGVSTPLLRPPYSSRASALGDADWSAIQQARNAGYLTVLSTLDSQDWRRPGAARVIANSIPRGTAGQILLMHDGGGDRSQTLAALQNLIPTVKARGFHFATVSGAVGLPHPVQPAGIVERGRGLAAIGAIRVPPGPADDLAGARP